MDKARKLIQNIPTINYLFNGNVQQSFLRLCKLYQDCVEQLLEFYKVLGTIKDGETPQIINGYWYVKGINTGVKAQGPAGADGETGATGESAYELAVRLGYEGTEEEWIESLSVNRGGTVYVEKYNSESLYDALVAALADNENQYTVFDCTNFQGTAEFPNTLYITKPCTILFGDITITLNPQNVSDINFFEIQSSNVQIIGYHRATDKLELNRKNQTVLVMGSNCVSNLSEKGYHIYSKGNKNLRFEFLTLNGVQTTLGRQCDNSVKPINGCGGIHLDKPNPVVTFGGNTCNNIIINQLLINGTKAHGIYISTPILATITNTRLSEIAGHGVFLNGATSTTLMNVYVASAQLAGVCFYECTYCGIINCVAEISSIGFLMRSSFNISLFNPGCEETFMPSNRPWSASYPTSNVYGFNIKCSGYTYNEETEQYDIPTTIRIPDVNDYLADKFVGTPFMIVGGRGISLYTPYATNICRSNSTALYSVERTALCVVSGNARKIFINNLQGAKKDAEAEKWSLLYHDIRIESNGNDSPNGVELIYDVENPLITGTFESYITPYLNERAPIYISATSQNVVVRNGGTYYTPVNFAAGANIDALNIQNVIADNIRVGKIRMDSTSNDIKIVNVEEVEIPIAVDIAQGYIGGTSHQPVSYADHPTDTDAQKRIYTTEFIQNTGNIKLAGIFNTSDSTLQTTGRVNVDVYTSNDYSTYYHREGFNNINLSTLESVNNYINTSVQVGEYVLLTIIVSGVTLDVTKSSLNSITVEETEVNKVLLEDTGDGTFVGDVTANNIN